jgi:hypothetical protein
LLDAPIVNALLASRSIAASCCSALLLVACGAAPGEAGAAEASATADGGAAAGPEDLSPAAEDRTGGAEPGLPGLDFRRFTMPAVDDAVPCGGRPANPAATIARVELAQTHLMDPSWPFFALTAGRPAMVKVDVTGSGAAPEVKVTAMRGATVLGSICLAGPSTLRASVDVARPSLASSFHATLPEAWVKRGVDLVVAAGAATRRLGAETLRVGAGPTFSLVTADVLLFGDAEPSPRNGFESELLAHLPVTVLQHAHFPAPLALPRLVVAPRSDGRDGNGNPAAQPAMWADRRPSCTSAEKAAGTCTRYDGRGVIATVRMLGEAVLRANGLTTAAIMYAAIGKNTPMGGGLAGGPYGAGDGYGLTFNHEIGHSFGMPHWGGVTGPASTDDDNVFPYAGDHDDGRGNPNGGGFGGTWAYDPLDDALVPPTCPSGKEMQDPMQRRDTCTKPGRVWDFYSDFSALRIQRYFTGAAAPLRGVVPYDGARVPFAMPATPGREEIVDASSGPPAFRKWSADAGAYVAVPPAARTFGSDRAIAKGPVYLVYGTFVFSSDTESTIYTPVLHRGYSLPAFDLTTPADFAALKASGAAAANGADLTLRAVYDDGTVRHVLLETPVRGDVANPTSGDGFRTFAVNVPADRKLVEATLLYRPIAVRGASDAFEGNLARERDITPANVYAAARVAAKWKAP